MKTYGEWRYSSTVLDIGTIWARVGQLHTPGVWERAFPPYRLNKRLSGTQSRSGHWRIENPVSPTGNLNSSYVKLVPRRYIKRDFACIPFICFLLCYSFRTQLLLGHAVALCYKPVGGGFESRWRGFFLIYVILPVALWPWCRLSL
jgi:hypothetical protein